MGLLKGIGNFFKKAVSGIGQFLNSPFGKLLVNVGLGVLTGGTSSLVMGLGSSLLKSAGGSLLGNVFGGVAQSFLGQASSWLSRSGLGAIADFGKQLVGGNTGQLADFAKNLFSARDAQPQRADVETQRIADFNAQNMVAWIHAQQLIRAEG